MINKNNCSINQEIDVFEVIKFIINHKISIIFSCILSLLIGVFYVYKNKNIYKTEVPISLEYSVLPTHFDLNYKALEIRNIFLNKKFIDIYKSVRKENFLYTFDIYYDAPFINLIIETNKSINSSDFDIIISSINQAIKIYNESHIQNISNIKSFSEFKFDNVNDYGSMIYNNLLLIEKDMDAEIQKLNEKSNIKSNNLVIELKSNLSQERQILIIKRQKFTNLLSSIKDESINLNKEVSIFSELQKKYEFLINIKENLPKIEQYPYLKKGDYNIQFKNNLRNIYIFSNLTVFVFFGFFISVLLNIIVQYFKVNKHRLNR